MMSAKRWNKMWYLGFNACCIVVNWTLVTYFVILIFSSSFLGLYHICNKTSRPYFIWKQQTSLLCYVSLCNEKGKFWHCHDGSYICDENVVTDSLFAKIIVMNFSLPSKDYKSFFSLTLTAFFFQNTVYADWLLVWYG